MKKRNALFILIALLLSACASQPKSDFFEQIKIETLSEKMSDAEAKGYSTILMTKYNGAGTLQGYWLTVLSGDMELENCSFDENQAMLSLIKMDYDAEGNMISRYSSIDRFGELSHGIHRYTYDENNNQLSFCLYDVSEDGIERLETRNEYEYVYDEEGKKISSVSYEMIEGEETICYRDEYVYEENGAYRQKTTYYSDGEAYRQRICQYDEQNRKVYEESGTILRPGTISEYNESKGWIYDDSGNLLREEFYVNADVESYIAYVYEKGEYSESCNWYEGAPKKEEVFKGGYVCEYNEMGQLCKRTEYDADGTETAVTYTYDEQGRVLQQRDYLRGACTQYYEYEYR